MILRDFLKLLSIGNSTVEVRSAYNDKLLCRNVWKGNHENIMMREVVAFRPEIRSTKDRAYPIIFCYVDGSPELNEYITGKFLEHSRGGATGVISSVGVT